MPRSKVVSVAGKEIAVEERRIGELKQLIADLVPGSGGNLSKVEIGKLLEGVEIDDVLYSKLPAIFPGLTKDDVDQAYMSELEELVSAFVDVHFLGLKSLAKPLMGMIQAGTATSNVVPPATSRQAGTTRKR